MPALTRNFDPFIKPPPGSILDRTHPAARNLVGLWLFNEGSGQMVFNQADPRLSVVSAAGTPTWGYTPAPGIPSTTGRAWAGAPQRAVTFDGSTYLTAPGNANTDCAKGVTMEVIFQPTASLSSGYVFAKRNASGNQMWALRFSDAFGASDLYMQINGGSAQLLLSLNDGAVYHVIATADGVTWKAYIHGQIIGANEVTLVQTSLPTADGGGTISFGAIAGLSFFQGQIAKAALYDRAITKDEAYQLFESPFGMMRGPEALRTYFIPTTIGGLNSRAKRMSAIHVASPWRSLYPIPE